MPRSRPSSARLRLRPELVAPRLNLALALFHRRRLQLALEAYRQVLAEHPHHAVAWNGVGLVLVELKRFEDAKHAFSRAVEADPANASAHYNLSFTLSHLGDFDGALRATKRALELEPFYVAQKYSLTIDLQYEHPEISIVPEISADVTAEQVGEDFPSTSGCSTGSSTNWIPPSGRRLRSWCEDPLSLAADYIAKGLLEQATVQIDRALARGTQPARATTLLGRGLCPARPARRGARAVPAVADPRPESAADAARRGPRAPRARPRARGGRAWPRSCCSGRPRMSRSFVVAARVRLPAGHRGGRAGGPAPGPGARARARRSAAAAGPGRRRSSGDVDGAVEAYQAALQLDPDGAAGLGGARPPRGAPRKLGRRPGGVSACARPAARPSWKPRSPWPICSVGPSPPRPQSSSWWRFCSPIRGTSTPSLLLGRRLLDDGRPDGAIEAFDRVLSFDPDHAAALFHRGVTLARVTALRRCGARLGAGRSRSIRRGPRRRRPAPTPVRRATSAHLHPQAA